LQEFHQKLLTTGKAIAPLEILMGKVPALSQNKKLQLNDFVATVAYLRRNSPILPTKVQTPTQYLSSDTDEGGSVAPTPVRQKKAATPVKSVRTPVPKPVLSTPVASFRTKPPTPSGLKSPLPPRLNLGKVGKEKSQPWIVVKDQLEEKIRGLEMELKRSSARVNELEEKEKKKEEEGANSGGGFSFGGFGDFTPSLGLNIPGMSADKENSDEERKSYIIQTMAWNVSYSTQNLRQHAIKSILVWYNAMRADTVRLEAEEQRKLDAAEAVKNLNEVLGENPVVVQLREANLDLQKMLLVQGWGRKYLEVKIEREKVSAREAIAREKDDQMTELKKEQYDKVHMLNQTQFDSIQKLEKEQYDNIREAHAQHQIASEKIRTDGHKVIALAQCRSVLIRAQNVLSAVCVINWRQQTETNSLQLRWDGKTAAQLATQERENENVQSNIRNDSKLGSQRLVQKQKRESTMKHMCQLMLNQVTILATSCLFQWKKCAALDLMKAALDEDSRKQMQHLNILSDQRQMELLQSLQANVKSLKSEHRQSAAIKQWAEILLRYQVATNVAVIHIWGQNMKLSVTEMTLGNQIVSLTDESAMTIRELSQHKGGVAVRRVFLTLRGRYLQVCLMGWRQCAQQETKVNNMDATRANTRQRAQAIAVRQLRGAMMHQGASKQNAQVHVAISNWRSTQMTSARLSGVGDVRRDCEARVTDLQGKLSDMCQTHEAKLAEMCQAREAKLVEMSQAHEARFTKMCQTHEAKLVEMSQLHETTVADLSASYEDHISEIQTQQQNQVETEHQTNLTALDTVREEHQAEMEKLNLQYTKSNDLAEKRRRDFHDRRAARMEDALNSTSKQAGLRGFVLFLKGAVTTQSARCITQWRENSRFELHQQTRGVANKTERKELLSQISLKGVNRALRHIQLAAVKHLIARWHVQEREHAVRSRPGMTEKGLLKTIESLKSQLLTSQTLFGEQLLKLEAERKEDGRFREKSELLQDRIEILEKKIVDDKLNHQDAMDSVVGLRTTIAQLERQVLVAEEESASLTAKLDDSGQSLQAVKAEKDALEERQHSSQGKVSFLAGGLVDFQVKAAKREKELEDRIAELEVVANRALTEMATPRSTADRYNNDVDIAGDNRRNRAPTSTARMKNGPAA